jgi:LacI family transcriptional regulator
VKHPHPVREIAAQSGLSEATVDRVLHQRGGVRESTARRVHQAVADLDRQQSESAGAAARTFPVDVVVHAPSRFAAAVETAVTAAEPVLVRPRFHRVDDPGDLIPVLDRIGRSRSQGLILSAPDTPEVAEQLGRLSQPVVALGTDMPASKRVAYCGVDNGDAGATAAYLVEQWLADRAGDVLLVRGRGASAGGFQGSSRADDEREAGFRAEMSSRVPNRRVLEVVGDDVHLRTRALLAVNPAVRAVYSLDGGVGGNASVVDAFTAENRKYDVLVAHELDAENTELLRAHKLSAVLHHDLRADLLQAYLTILRALGAAPGTISSRPSPIQVITPYNVP